MAITFPASRATFANTLRVSAVEMHLGGAVEMNRTASGEILQASMGARLWQGKISLAEALTPAQVAAQALLLRMSEVDASFFLYDPFHQYPAADPTGSILGAATVTIGAIQANNRELTLAGLPVGYVISAGDFVSFTYGSAPTRYAYHQVVTGGTAGGGGATGNIEVMPPIRSGAAAGATVTLKQPVLKGLIAPGSLAPRASRPLISSGLSFDFIQTLR